MFVMESRRDEIDSFHPSIRIYPIGETIIEEGSQDKVLFLLRVGRVGIYRRMGEQQEKIATIDAINFVGEMSLINDEPRSATVRADAELTLVYAITKPNLSLILSNPKWAELLVSRLSKNLNELNVQYSSATRSIQDLQVELERLRKEVDDQKQAVRQFQKNAGQAFSAILYYQNVVRNLAVVGSKGWMYLKVLSEASRALARHYMPGVELNEDLVDPRVMRESLASIQQPGQGNILEDFYHSLHK